MEEEIKEDKKEKERKNSVLREVVEWIICIILAVVLALVFRYYIGTPTIVKQVSMYPTLQEDQRLWLNRWSQTMNKIPERGDIVTFESPSVGVLTESQLRVDNAVAYYDYEPESLFEKFKYYVLESGKDSYIKRVIALPGEHVEIKEGKIYIDGEVLIEDYVESGIATDVEGFGYTDFVVPEGTLFLVGDNRNHSTDSRHFGCVPFEKIESVMAFRFWPLNEFGGVE